MAGDVYSPDQWALHPERTDTKGSAVDDGGDGAFGEDGREIESALGERGRDRAGATRFIHPVDGDSCVGEGAVGDGQQPRKVHRLRYTAHHERGHATVPRSSSSESQLR